MNVRLDDVRRLHLDPGDVLVIRLAEKVADQLVVDTGRQLQEWFPANKVIVLPPGAQVGTINGGITQTNLFEAES